MSGWALDSSRHSIESMGSWRNKHMGVRIVLRVSEKPFGLLLRVHETTSRRSTWQEWSLSLLNNQAPDLPYRRSKLASGNLGVHLKQLSVAKPEGFEAVVSGFRVPESSDGRPKLGAKAVVCYLQIQIFGRPKCDCSTSINITSQPILLFTLIFLSYPLSLLSFSKRARLLLFERSKCNCSISINISSMPILLSYPYSSLSPSISIFSF